MRVSVRHTLDDLQRDMERMPPELYRQGAAIVRRSASEGGKIARMIAREKDGPHGKAYWKRINWDRSARIAAAFGSGSISAEYGPDGFPKTDFVGAGWRHGTNTDLEKSMDLIGPIMAGYVRDMLDDFFWPGA